MSFRSATAGLAFVLLAAAAGWSQRRAALDGSRPAIEIREYR